MNIVVLDCCEDKTKTKKKNNNNQTNQKKHVALNLLEHGPAY